MTLRDNDVQPISLPGRTARSHHQWCCERLHVPEISTAAQFGYGLLPLRSNLGRSSIQHSIISSLSGPVRTLRPGECHETSVCSRLVIPLLAACSDR